MIKSIYKVKNRYHKKIHRGLDASKEFGIEVNAEKTKYMIRPCNQTEAKIMTKSDKIFENVAKFRYLGTRVTNAYCNHEKLRAERKSKNAC
jgi:hypothetical protein